MKMFLPLFVLTFSVFATDSKTMTLKEWKSLDADEQNSLLGEEVYNYEGFEELEFYGGVALPPEYQDLFLKAQENAQAPLDNLEFDDTHATVGDGRVSYITVYKLEGELVGINIGYHFPGCDMEDESSPHFATKDEAEEAGCEFSDVSWSWTGTFNSKGELVYDPGYPEWTGY